MSERFSKAGDIASYVSRTENLTDKGKLEVALELIHLSGVSVRPEVTTYLKEAISQTPEG